MTVVEINKAINAPDVADRGSTALFEVLQKLQSVQDRIDIGLTGGTVGILTLKHFSERSNLDLIDFSKVHFWFGDERYVESTSSDRNANQARSAMLDKLQISPEFVHEFPAKDSGLELAEAAQLFDEYIREELDEKHIDFMFMGMGPDGHVASLFPGHDYPNKTIVAEANSPKPPAERLSMSFEFINRTKEVVFVVSGIDKAEAIEDVHKNPNSTLPAARIKATQRTLWIIDEAAGAAFWSC